MPTPATSAIRVSPFSPAQSIDPGDAHPIPVTANGQMPQGQRGYAHIMAVAGTQPVTLTYSSERKPVMARRAPSSTVNAPSDVSYFGGVVIGGAASHPLYVSTNYGACDASCWGNPGVFLTNLGASGFISTLDQYIGLTAPNRYTKGNAASASTTLTSPSPGRFNPTLSESQLLVMLFSAASALGAGYGNVYHIFLPPGIDTCFDQTSICYSPDRPQNYVFCGYHSSIDWPSYGMHVIYTVEPYQNVPGCAIFGGPNSSGGSDLVDSTSNTLSHELFESITDPDVGTGWFNLSLGEIGDLCRQFITPVSLNGSTYAIQSEYSDGVHGCTNGP